jgi:hypothetical protein
LQRDKQSFIIKALHLFLLSASFVLESNVGALTRPGNEKFSFLLYFPDKNGQIPGRAEFQSEKNQRAIKIIWNSTREPLRPKRSHQGREQQTDIVTSSSQHHLIGRYAASEALSLSLRSD